MVSFVRLPSGLIGAVALSAFLGAFGTSSGSEGPIVASRADRAATVAALPANQLPPPPPIRTPPAYAAHRDLFWSILSTSPGPRPTAFSVYAGWGTIDAPPLTTIQGSHTHLHFPADLATHSGKLYVLNVGALQFAPGKEFITVYSGSPNPSGNASPVATISGVSPSSDNRFGRRFNRQDLCRQLEPPGSSRFRGRRKWECRADRDDRRPQNGSGLIQLKSPSTPRAGSTSGTKGPAASSKCWSLLRARTATCTRSRRSAAHRPALTIPAFTSGLGWR